MSERILQRYVVVTNPQGLHARPADLFVRTAKKYESRIHLVKDAERVDGKSILDILTLGATQGTQLLIEAIGQDADAALDALVDLVAGIGSEEGSDPGRSKSS